MQRPEFLDILEKHRNGAWTITGPGLASRQFYAAVGSDDPSVYYNMEMQYATPMCMGLALARPSQRVIALEGDGSMISALGSLSTVGRYKTENLTIVILDNESYSTFGKADMRSATADGLDLEGVAKACCISKAKTVRTIEEAEEWVPRAMTEPGPWVLVAKLEPQGDTDPNFSVNSPDGTDQAVYFSAHIRNKKA